MWRVQTFRLFLLFFMHFFTICFTGNDNCSTGSLFFPFYIYIYTLSKKQRYIIKTKTHHLAPDWVNIGFVWYTSVKVLEAVKAIDLMSLRTGSGIAFIESLSWCCYWRFFMSWNIVVSFHLEMWLLLYICSMSLSSVRTINLWSPNSVALIIESLIAKSLASLKSCTCVVLQPTKMTWPSLSLPIYAIPWLVRFFDVPHVVVMMNCQFVLGVHLGACAVCLTPPVVPALLE